MTLRQHCPTFSRAFNALTGHWPRRIGLAIFCLLLLVTATVRLRTYLMVREIQTVLQGLSQIRLDQTSEGQLRQMIPHITFTDSNVGRAPRRYYHVHISNEDDRLPRILFFPFVQTRSETLMNGLGRIMNWLGYRFLSFDATVLAEDGKVTHVSYGLANQWMRPQAAGYIGYLVSARSVHAFWLGREFPFEVSSVDDLSPQYRPRGDKEGLNVIYTADAPSRITDRIFRLDLSCFWGLHDCTDARTIAPLIWKDLQAIRYDTYRQLTSGRCPDSIVEGRMQYLPDVSVLLLEVIGSRRIKVSEEGQITEDWFTDYELKEVIRGRSSSESWKNIRLRRTIRAVDDPDRVMANQIWPEAKIGTRVLFFGNMRFASCRFIPASPSALEIARKTSVPPKRPEDQILTGLM